MEKMKFGARWDNAYFVESNKLTAFDDIVDGFKYNFNEMLLQHTKSTKWILKCPETIEMVIG